MKNVALLFLLILITTGCATVPIPTVSLDKTTITTNKQEMTIGLVSTPYPEIDTSVPGADCLLCFAVASGIISDITEHVKTLDSDLDTLNNLMLNKIKNQGFRIKMVSDKFDFNALKSVEANEKTPQLARYDFKPLASKHNISHLLVLNITSHGIVRNFANYVPTSPPFAAIYGSAYLVDLNKNEYVWYENIRNTLNAEGEWDNPPSFPELTNAYYSVLESTKDSLQQAFSFENNE